MPDCYGNKISLADWRKCTMPGEETVLSVPVVRVSSPCEECGKPGVNLKYNLVGISGVLCQECLEKVIRQVNRALDATAKEDSTEQG